MTETDHSLTRELTYVRVDVKETNYVTLTNGDVLYVSINEILKHSVQHGGKIMLYSDDIRKVLKLRVAAFC